MRNKATPSADKVISSPVPRTSSGLRDALFDELESLRSGKTDNRRAVAVAALAVTIVKTVRMELEFARVLPSKGAGASNVPPRLNLGS